MSFGVFQFRRGTPAIWSSVNPILADGELGLEKGTGLFKVGNGVDAWNSLPYGGIKGDAGDDAMIQVGTVLTGAPGSEVIVTNSGTPQNAIFNFSIPRGDVGATGNKGWSPVLAVVSDGQRRVLQLVDYVDGQGTKPAIPTNNYIGATGLTTLAGAIDIRGEVGATGPAVALSDDLPRPLDSNDPNAGVSTQASRADHSHSHGNQGGGTLHADATTTISGFMSGADKTKLNGIQSGAQVNSVNSVGAGAGISVNQTTGAVVVTNTDTGSASRTAHEAAADPHPQYTTTAEAAAAAPVQSVNGQTGAVVVAAGTNNKAVSRSSATASASTALTSLASLAIDAGEVQPGSMYEFFASLRVINTTTATNSVVTLRVGGTNLLVLTQANGTTAAATPGAPVQIFGRITFYSATQAEAVIHFAKSQAVAANIILNTSAPVAVSAAGATTVELLYNTSGTTATFICRQASIHKVA